MSNYTELFTALSILLVLVLFFGSSGCISTLPHDDNQAGSGNFAGSNGEGPAPGKLADTFLENAGNITDYRTAYRMWVGNEEDPSIDAQIRLDYLSPESVRVELLDGEGEVPYTVWITNGSSTIVCDAQSRTCNPYFGPDLIGSNDYQHLAREVVEDRHFTVLGRDTVNGTERYLIEAAAIPWAANFTPYPYSHVRAWIEPSTGLAWAITITNESLASPVRTPPLGSLASLPNVEVRYESVDVNAGIPESLFDPVPPEGYTTLQTAYWK